MKKLFLSLVLSAGLVAGITSCQPSEDAIAPEVAGVDLIEYYSQVALANYEEIKDRQSTFLVSGPTATGTDTWTAGNTYVMSGPIVVRDGDTLVIEEGALVKAFPGQGIAVSYLLVERGGTIIANGSAASPIIFTSLADRIEPGQVIIPEEFASLRLPVAARGLWGGVLILGEAFNCVDPVIPSQGEIAGVPEFATSVGINGNHTIDRTFGPRTGEGTDGAFGGSSGSMRYCSIRHGGTRLNLLDPVSDINGLSLASVGNGTTIDFVEVIANRNDGFKFIGGTVNTKHLVASFCGDDHFDTDICFQGSGQYWFSWQDNVTGDNGAEQDGAIGAVEAAGAFFASPVVANATYLGYITGTGGSRPYRFRDNSGGLYGHSIFANHGRQADVEAVGAVGVIGSSRPSSDERLAAGDLGLTCVIFDEIFGVAPGTLPIRVGGAPIVPANFPSSVVNTSSAAVTFAGDFITPTSANATTAPVDARAAIAAFFADANNAISTTRNNPIDLTFFDQVTYKGAFDPAATPWVFGWTAWEEYYLENNLPGGPL